MNERRTTVCVRRLPFGKPRKELELSMCSHADRPYGLVRVAVWSDRLAEIVHSTVDILGMAVVLLAIVSVASPWTLGNKDFVMTDSKYRQRCNDETERKAWRSSGLVRIDSLRAGDAEPSDFVQSAMVRPVMRKTFVAPE